MIVTPGMAVLLLAGYGIWKLWKKKSICNEDFILFAILAVVSAMVVILDEIYDSTYHLPENLKPIMQSVIENKSEESIIGGIEDLTKKPNVFNAMLEKREKENWFIKFLAWPIDRPWSHVVGSDNVDKYKTQWKLGDTYYQATVVLREEQE